MKQENDSDISFFQGNLKLQICCILVEFLGI